MEASHPEDKHLRIGAWQAAVLFQIFGFMTLALDLIWSYLVLYDPKSLSQYLPYEYPINATDNAAIVPVVAIWGVIAYLSLKGSMRALLASLVYSLLVIVLLLPSYLLASYNAAFYGSTFDTVSLPSFGTILLIIIVVVVAGLDLIAYRSSQQRSSLLRVGGRA